jgi:hypothetical protein
MGAIMLDFDSSRQEQKSENEHCTASGKPMLSLCLLAQMSVRNPAFDAQGMLLPSRGMGQIEPGESST